MEQYELRAWQVAFLRLRSNKLFEAFVIVIIVLSALMVGARTYDESTRFDQVLFALDWAVTLFFVTEILIRMLAERRLRDFFKSGWNIFDFVIVVASLIPVDQSETVLLARLLRVFRVLRLVSLVPELRMLMNAFLKALPRMGYVAMFMFIIFYIYGAIGSFLFHDVNPFYWDNISVAMLTLFRVATFESWTEIMYETMAVYPWSWFYYLSFIFLSAFIFLNMMIGIVLEVMQKESAAESLEQGEGEAADLHWLREHVGELQSELRATRQLLEQRLDPPTEKPGGRP